jgi:hypothetical protein
MMSACSTANGSACRQEWSWEPGKEKTDARKVCVGQKGKYSRMIRAMHLAAKQHTTATSVIRLQAGPAMVQGAG